MINAITDDAFFFFSSEKNHGRQKLPFFFNHFIDKKNEVREVIVSDHRASIWQS